MTPDPHAAQRAEIKRLRKLLDDRPLTLAVAAERLGIHQDTLRRQIRLGKLTGHKVGPIWTVTEREVERYRREHQR